MKADFRHIDAVDIDRSRGRFDYAEQGEQELSCCVSLCRYFETKRKINAQMTFHFPFVHKFRSSLYGSIAIKVISTGELLQEDNCVQS